VIPCRNRRLELIWKGVAANPTSLQILDAHYRETDGSSTYYNSPNKIFVPILQHNLGAYPGLMVNLHSHEPLGMVIEGMVVCVKTNDEKCGSDRKNEMVLCATIAITDAIF
jgi:hypothetical protein